MRTAAPLMCLVLVTGCSTGPLRDPIAVLGQPDAFPRQQVRAMEQLDEAPTPEYIQTLKQVIVAPGYIQSVREDAFERLARLDRPALEDVIEVNLARMQALQWRAELCRRIAQMKWTALAPALIRSWAMPVVVWDDTPEERPERVALVAMYGADGLIPELFRVLNDPALRVQDNLRMRTWELLVAQGQGDRLRAELAATTPDPRDALMLELKAGVDAFEILPRNKEEILWLRALMQPKNRAFMERAKHAVAALPADVREHFEVREIPIALAVATTWPELASRTNAELFEQVRATVKPSRFSPSFDGLRGEFSETLYDQKSRLTWGDCALMLVLHRALQDAPLRTHLFELGDADVNDRGTEHGGLLQIDDKGRIDAVAFVPRVRGSDVRFEASQEMFDAGYTALTHFHFHAQSYDNSRYAGPHVGDFSYADANGVNGVVFCFIDSRRLNVDFYRRGRVVVDLGIIDRP